MSAETAGRVAALAIAALLRARGPRAGAPVVGVLLAVALFGPGPAALPSWPEAGVLAASLASLFALLVLPGWPPIASAAAESALFFGLPVMAWGAFVLRGRPLPDAAAGIGAVAATLGAVAAGGSQASGEAGWRRAGLWLAAVGAGAVAGTGVACGAVAVRSPYRWLLAVLGLAAAVAAFLPALAVEARRVRRELGEEAKLGVLPPDDVEVLASPWRRLREPRFGRADERRTYVRSALLLAVALQQQRRRTGTAVRLRQLEVLTFRTRVRRTLEARSGRASASSDELTLPA